MEVVEVVAVASTALQSAVLQPQPFPGATEVTLQQNTQNGKNLTSISTMSDCYIIDEYFRMVFEVNSVLKKEKPPSLQVQI